MSAALAIFGVALLIAAAYLHVTRPPAKPSRRIENLTLALGMFAGPVVALAQAVTP